MRKITAFLLLALLWPLAARATTVCNAPQLASPALLTDLLIGCRPGGPTSGLIAVTDLLALDNWSDAVDTVAALPACSGAEQDRIRLVRPPDAQAGVYHCPAGGGAWALVGGAGGTDDQVAAEVPFTPAGGIAATDVQAALEEVDAEHTVDTDTTCLDAGVDCLFAASASEGGAASSVAVDAVGTAGLDDDANIPGAGDFVIVETGAVSFGYLTPNAGTNVTADLEEETHAAEHASGGGDAADHDTLTNFVADEHVAHSGVTLTAGPGLGGGGDISANRTFTTASQEAAFLADGGVTSLTCGAAAAGKAQVLDSGALQYCDGATTSVLRTGFLDADGVDDAGTDDQAASEVPYTPTTGTDWVDPDPTSALEGLDDLAARLTVEEAKPDDDVPEAGDFGALALTGPVTSTGLATTIGGDTVGTPQLDDGSETPAARDVLHVDPADTGQFIYLPAPAGGTNGCAGAADKVIFNSATNTWGCGADAGAGGGMTSWTGAGDSGTPVTITDGETFMIEGGDGITTAAAAGPERVTVTSTLGTAVSAGELDFDPATQAELDAHEGDAEAHHPTGLVRTDATNCTALTDGVAGQVCVELDSERVYTCQPTAGGCDTPGEWIPITIDGAAITTGTVVEPRIDSTLTRDSESPAAGDVTGSYSAGLQVTDDSHSHGASTIAGLDAGDTTTGTFADARIDGSLEADEVNPTLGTQTQGNYVDDVTAGVGIAVTHTPGEGSDAAVALSFADAGTDPVLGAGGATFSNEGASAAGLVFEGDTNDANETRLRVTDPTADRVVTIPDADSTTVQPDDGAVNNFLTAISAAGVVSRAQPSFANLSGQVADGQIADGAVDGGTGGEIADGSITAADLGPDSVGASELDAAAVESELEAVLDHDDLQGFVAAEHVPQRQAATDCTAETGGVTGEICEELDANVFYVCETGPCNGSGWVSYGGAGGINNVVEDTTPQLGGQLDVNGFAIGDGTLELMTFTEAASAVNQLNVTNAATGAGPVLGAAGGDTDIDINLTPKGAGAVRVNGPLETQASPTPTVAWKDSDATAGDENATATVNCTDVGDGTEDCDWTLSVQVAGALTARISVDADGNTEISSLTEGGNAVPNATDHLGFFAATTSAQLAGVLSDETGTGVSVFGTAPTFTTSITSPVLISGAADPADAGAVRLGNAEAIAWEASPPGTDFTLAVDASEILQASGTINAGGLSVGGTAVLTAETNDLEAADPPTIADTEIYVGNGAGSGTFVVMSGDASLANTGAVTVTGVQCSGSCIADGEVDDTITASNYLPLAGGTLTGQLVTDNLGIDFADSDINPTCGAGDYLIYADLSETTLKKCLNGVATNLDTTGGTPAFSDISGATNTTAAMVVGTGASLSASGSGTITATGVAANSVALTTDTTGNYAAGDAEAGNALTGDSATAFFSAGQIEATRGGTGDDTSAVTGVPRITTGNWTYDAGLSHLAVSTSADLRGVLSDESGTGAAIFAGGAIGAATATTAVADDSSTLVATTAYVQGEINGAGGRSLTCSSGNCDADAEIYTRIESIAIPDPATTDSGDVQLMFPTAVTITRIACSTNVATSTATIQFDERAAATPDTAGTDVMTAQLVCDTNEQATTSFTNAGIASRVPMNLDIDAVANAPTVLRIFVEYTIDD